METKIIASKAQLAEAKKLYAEMVASGAVFVAKELNYAPHLVLAKVPLESFEPGKFDKTFKLIDNGGKAELNDWVGQTFRVYGTPTTAITIGVWKAQRTETYTIDGVDRTVAQGTSSPRGTAV